METAPDDGEPAVLGVRLIQPHRPEAPSDCGSVGFSTLRAGRSAKAKTDPLT